MPHGKEIRTAETGQLERYYKIASKAVWLGKVGAVDKAAAIEKIQVVFCFFKPEDADAFAKRFGGEPVAGDLKVSRKQAGRSKGRPLIAAG